MEEPKQRQLSAMQMMLGNMSAMDVSDHYEALITTGKLRVVVEVNSCEDTGCSKCGHYTEDQYGQYSFCPGCGNKIKR